VAVWPASHCRKSWWKIGKMVENPHFFYGEIIDPVAKIEQFAMRQVFEYLQLMMMRVRLTCPPFISDTLPIS